MSLRVLARVLNSVSLCPTAVLASALLQCLRMSYNNAHHCPLSGSLYVLQHCLSVSYYSVILCPTPLLSNVPLQILYMTYSSVFECLITVSPYVLQQ